MKLQPSIAKRARILFASVLVACLFAHAQETSAQAADKFYYWVAPGTDPQTQYGREYKREEGFVVEVDAEIASRIDAGRAQGAAMGIGGIVAANSAPYNRNYFLPGHPIWNWHFSVVNEVHFIDIFFGTEDPVRDSNPSDIAANPGAWDGKRYAPRFYEVKGRIDPARSDAVANVSNRGLTGAGERRLITGFIVTGGQPRNIVVRALGPSLGTAGIQQAAANPKIEVYQGSARIATNADWKSGARANSLAQNYSALAPTNDKEAALLLTLLPGAYTLHGINEDGTEGIILLEAYDVDSAVP